MPQLLRPFCSLFFLIVQMTSKRIQSTLFFLVLSITGYAQTLTIAGEVTKPLTLQGADLKAMPHTEVTVKERDGKDHRYSGVSLIELLKQAGVTVCSELRGKNLTKYVLIRANDGYEVLFALAELDPEFTTRTILLADSVDGAALLAGTGPYRIVIPDEKKPTRWVREVKAIEIQFAK
jgi:DMSO/TMAO reductase YedYZ molybdopterin-dependent catalytic subunit